MRNQSTTSTRDHVKLTPYVLSMIFDEIAVNLPNPDMRRITPLKCLYVISNQSNTKGSNNTSAIDFGILIIELFQKDDVFLDFKISKLTKGCGQLSALLKIVVKSFFLTLKLCGVRAVKVKNDLTFIYFTQCKYFSTENNRIVYVYWKIDGIVEQSEGFEPGAINV